MKTLAALYAFMLVNGNNLSYNADLKNQFKKLSTSFLRELARNLPFQEKKISFNPGGIAVSGNANLMGMFDNGIGLYISINEPTFRQGAMTFLFRTISHMKDYSGGSNNYMTQSDFQDGEHVIRKIKSLCNLPQTEF